MKELRPSAAQFADATPNLTTTFSVLNAFLNGLAYNPPGKSEGYLFYLAWLNHVSNSIFSAQDAQGPIRRGVLMTSCADIEGVNGVRNNRSLAFLTRFAAVWLLTQLVNAPADCRNLPAGH